MSSLRLTIGGKSIVVYPLNQSRAVAVKRIVSRGRVTWAQNENGKVYTNDISRLKARRSFSGTGDEMRLTNDDIIALDLLGVVDGDTVKKLIEGERYRRDYQHRYEWLMGDTESLLQSGVKLCAGWQKKIEAAAHKRAKELAAKRKAKAKGVKA